MFVLKYANGKFVGEDIGSGGYPYETRFVSSAKFFVHQIEADRYLANLIRGFLNDKFDELVYQVTVSPV